MLHLAIASVICILLCILFYLSQVDVRSLKYYYMEDDGGGLMLTPAYPVIKETVRKVSIHIVFIVMSKFMSLFELANLPTAVEILDVVFGDYSATTRSPPIGGAGKTPRH